MRLRDATRIVLDGREALRATLNGQVVWSADALLEGSVYTQDFSGYTVGDTTVAGFTSRWATIAREIVEVGGERALRLQTTGETSTNERAVFTYDAVDNDPERVNVSIFMQVLTTVDSDGFAPIRAATRVAGSVGTETAVVGGTALNSNIRIDQYNNGAFSTLESASFNHDQIRMNSIMRINGGIATLKAWVAGDPEPDNPQVTATADVTAEGAVGFFIFSQPHIDLIYFSIATGEREPVRKPETDPLEGFSSDPEVAAITGMSSTNDQTTSLAAPRNLLYGGVPNLWGYYFAVIEDAAGQARELELQNADAIGGTADSQVHLANWSADPNSDQWTPLAFQAVSDNRISFATALPDNLSQIAITRTPGYTVTRVYNKTAEYRQSQYVSDPPSTTDGNYALQVSPNDWAGRAVPDLPMPAYLISGGSSGDKNIVVLTAGNHPYEMHADYNLEGSVDFLLSEDPIAQNLRQWCDIFVYPTINPAGRWAGYSRANPELKAAGLHDHNRIWGSTNRDTTVKLKAAFQADFAQSCDVLIDYHTFVFNDESIDRGIWAIDSEQNLAFMSRYAARDPASVNNRTLGAPSQVNSLPDYGAINMGALVSVHSEESPSIARNVVEYRESGKALMLALWDMIDDGLLPHGPA